MFRQIYSDLFSSFLSYLLLPACIFFFPPRTALHSSMSVVLCFSQVPGPLHHSLGLELNSPCAGFSLTSIDDHQALFYGGVDGEHHYISIRPLQYSSLSHFLPTLQKQVDHNSPMWVATQLHMLQVLIMIVLLHDTPLHITMSSMPVCG